MKTNSRLLTKGIVLAMLAVPTSMAAQQVAVENMFGYQSGINLDEVNSIVFSSGIIKFNMQDCQSEFFALATTELIELNAVVSVDNGNFEEQSLLLFPNPTEDQFVLTVSEAQINETAAIWTSAGVCVKKWKVNKSTSTIDVNDLPSGLYIVQVGNTNAKLMKR